MEENFVIVDQNVRSEKIRSQIEKLAKEKGGKAEITEDLLEEVVYLVEYPTALCGSFEEKYLKLPPEAVITPMREHQRYFPVKSSDGKLLPLFITVRNGGSEHLEIVQHGNERVLRARLADAQFFFEEDCKVKLSDRVEKLKTVVFQEGLGSVYDKTQRLVKLGEFLHAAVQAGDADEIKRAAFLAKADLVTGMVCEFTELQGVMGRAYARLNGESEIAATAIYEHYLPRFAGDELPKTHEGRLVGIADKIDNIVATFSRGLVPTGSQDPYALRRQALGIVNILLDAKYSLSLAALVNEELDLLAIDDKERRAEILQNVQEFFALRLKNVLADENVRYDVVDGVLAAGIDDIYETCQKARALAKVLAERDMTKAVQSFVRVSNLAKKAADVAVDENLFAHDAEKSLYAAYKKALGKADAAGRDYAAVIAAAEELTPAIDLFFDNVMVMDKDEKIKNNRLALLRGITALTERVADFGKLVL
jgi:glycyl-tRNA synthetase beta chain